MRNIALIVLDTVRKDYFDDYSPRLQEMASVNHDNMYSASSWSVPSHASILTGKLAHQHGIHTYSRHFDISTDETFLNNIHHTSHGSSANVYASPSFGFDQYFDDFKNVSPQRRFPDGIDVQKFIQDCEDESVMRYVNFLGKVLRHDNTLKSIYNGFFLKTETKFRRTPIMEKPFDDGASGVLSYASQEIREPWFKFINLMDAHGPLHPVSHYDSDLYDVGKGWTTIDQDMDGMMTRDDLSQTEKQNITNHRQLYGTSIDYMDQKVSGWISDHRDGNTTFIVTADHGENLLYDEDRNLWSHSSSLTESLINVPFVVIDPPENTEVEDGNASHLDFPDMMREIASENSLTIPSREVVPVEVIGSGLGELETDVISEEEWESAKRALIMRDEKIVWDSLGNIERVNRDDDSDRETLSSLPPEAEDEFDVSISEAQDTAQRSDSEGTSDEVRARLEDLGYA